MPNQSDEAQPGRDGDEEEEGGAEDSQGESATDESAPDTGGDTDEEVGETFPASDPPANY